MSKLVLHVRENEDTCSVRVSRIAAFTGSLPSRPHQRPEHLLDGLRARLPEVTGGDDDVADYLRVNELVIVYLGPDWMLEQLQSEAGPTAPPPNCLCRCTGRVPQGTRALSR